MPKPLPGDDQQNLSNTSQQGVGSQVRVEPAKQPVVTPPQPQPPDFAPPAVGAMSGKQPTQPVSGRAKEQKEAGPLGRPEAEKVPITEVKEPEPSKEVEGWVEKIEKGEDVKLKKPIVDDYGQLLVKASAPQQPKIVLPLDEGEVEEAKKHKVVDSIRWLAEWCLRVIKLAHGRVFYRKN